MQNSFPIASEKSLRNEVRQFIQDCQSTGILAPRIDGWFFGFSPEFSAAMGDKGWVGMAIPEEYGGGGRSARDRFIIIEELLAVGAPMNAHWVADRQTGPTILKYGTEKQKREYLPQIASGRFVAAIGMSERGSGSDLSSVQTTATKVDGGWELEGQKVWMGNAHRGDITVVLARTDTGADKTEALSQFIVDLKSSNMQIRPIPTMTGSAHFCEVNFHKTFVPEENLLGQEGAGWNQVLSELSIERTGPERYMGTFVLLSGLFQLTQGKLPTALEAEFGLWVSRLMALRTLAIELLEPENQSKHYIAKSAAFKEVATRFETELPEFVRKVQLLVGVEDQALTTLYQSAINVSPASTIRGGTTEIMNSIVARALL